MEKFQVYLEKYKGDMMNNKKGITMIMLVIYIIIVIILTGTIISNFLGNQSIKDTTEAVFISRISDCIDEFNTNKNYYIINNTDTSTFTIDNYIPSISISDKIFLVLDQGELKFRNIEPTNRRYNMLINLGLSEYVENPAASN